MADMYPDRDGRPDPYGLNNPHRGNCKLCGRRKRVEDVGGYLIRICVRCDCTRPVAEESKVDP